MRGKTQSEGAARLERERERERERDGAGGMSSEMEGVGGTCYTTTRRAHSISMTGVCTQIKSFEHAPRELWRPNLAAKEEERKERAQQNGLFALAAPTSVRDRDRGRRLEPNRTFWTVLSKHRWLRWLYMLRPRRPEHRSFGLFAVKYPQNRYPQRRNVNERTNDRDRATTNRIIVQILVR